MLPYQNSALPTEQRISDLLSRMTVREKIGQLCQTPMLDFEEKETHYLNGVRQGLWGSRILADTAWAGNAPGLTVDPVQLNKIQRVAVEESRLGIPLIVARDVIYGQRTVLPIPLAQAASWNPEQVERAYNCISREAASLGIHWTFSPMLDIVRDPRWGRVIESSGEDPFIASEMAQAVVRGFQGANLRHPDSLVACAKHFVGYGASEGGRDYDTTEISLNSLYNVYLPPFKAAIEAGVQTIMSGFNDLGGTPVSGSQALIRQWLKIEQDFEGLVISDWGSISDLAYFGVASNAQDAAKLALEAGVDMAMTNEAYEQHLEHLLEQAQIDISLIDEAVQRVLGVKFRAGLFEQPYVNEQRHLEVMRHPEHVKQALSLACQSMVLLKNNQDILPLVNRSTGHAPLTIAVIGPHAHSQRQHLGSWCLDGQADDVTSIYQGIQVVASELDSNVSVITEESSFSDEMTECAHRADIVILCTGESHRRTGEARNIAELALPAGQEELISAIGQTGKPLVVVQCTGRPIPSPATEQYADALLYAWQSGTEAGRAVAELIFGLRSPSGRLPMSVPRSTGQIPIYYARKPLGKMRDFQTYQPYKDLSVTPLYPFGFGLTYGSFEYSNLNVGLPLLGKNGTQVVRVTVRNIGEHAATEVVQCYLRRHVAQTTRPERELKAFERVTLEPGEEREVCLDLSPESLGYFGLNGTWRSEPSPFTVFVGGDAQASMSACFDFSGE